MSTTVQKYHRALINVHAMIQDGEKIPENEFCKEIGVTNTFFSGMRRMEIVSGGSRQGAPLKWLVDYPSWDLAQQLLSHINESVKKSKSSASKPKEEVEDSAKLLYAQQREFAMMSEGLAQLIAAVQENTRVTQEFIFLSQVSKQENQQLSLPGIE